MATLQVSLEKLLLVLMLQRQTKMKRKEPQLFPSFLDFAPLIVVNFFHSS